ncbi:MAG: homocysteine S-methyltransferase family protein, partial [Acutalibacteraceae bacterium]
MSKKSKAFLDELNNSIASGSRTLFFEGGMGALLQQKGLTGGEIPDAWSITHPEVVQSIHRDYLRAGCNIVKANTFGANIYKLKNSGYSVDEVISASLSLANGAIDEINPNAYCALDIGSLGKLLSPLGDLPFEDAYDAFAQMIVAARDKCDVILIETMNDTYETKAAVLAAKENCDLPIIISMIFDENAKLLTGGDIDSAVALLEGLGVDVLGVNCGLGPKQMLKILPHILEISSTPVVCSPNAELPKVVDGKTVFDITPEKFADYMAQIAEMGAVILGGCCGTNPAHLKAMVERTKSIAVKPVTQKNLTVVSSYNHAVYFSDKPLVIGERINPTGKSKLKAALRENDLEYIINEAINQEDSGAHILDVNVGLPEIDEVDMMRRVICESQKVTALPLQIDTSNYTAMETAMRIYNGKPLINSVNGKRESMEAVFPLVKKYGGAVIALCLDENGIPETVEGRIAVAQKIIDTAKSYGIDKSALIFDALTITISTGQQNAQITLETTRRLRYELGVHTTLGVSNVSFGLPMREKINTAFFTLAMQSGLSAGIINPMSDAMMSAYYSFCALNQTDENCAQYIEKFSNAAVDAPQTGKQITLKEAVIKGLSAAAEQSAAELLKTEKPLEIINSEIVPALDEVGSGFEKGSIFLPQLLMSADAAKAAFKVINEKL